MKKKTKGILICGGILLFYLGLQFIPYPKGDQLNSAFIRKEGEQPLIIAHGGAKELFPENTLLAYDEVIKMGVDAIEVDVRMSKDHTLLSIHNEDIDAYTKQKGKVEAYTYEELKQFNFGYHFIDLEGNYPYRMTTEKDVLDKLCPMRIEDMFQRYQDKILYILEIKEKGERGKETARILLEYIKKYHLEKKVCVAGFDDEVMNYFYQIKTDKIMSVLPYKQTRQFVVANYVGYGGFIIIKENGLMMPHREDNITLDDSYLIWKIHKHHMFVYYWTIDNKKQMRILMNRGVDGIISDRIDLLKEVMIEAKE